MKTVKRAGLVALATAMLLLAVVGSQTTFTLGTTPGNPGAGKIRLWANTSSGKLECTNSSGAVGCITGGAASVVSPSFSATPTYTCPSAVNGSVTTFAVGTLTANITSSTLAGCTPGQTLKFVFTQDGTGGWTVVMPSGFDPPSISLTASSVTTLAYTYDGASSHLDGFGYSPCSGCAGVVQIGQGTAPSSFGTNAFNLFAPTSIATAFGWKTPAAAANGLVRGDNSSNTVTLSQAELSGDCTTSGSLAVTCAVPVRQNSRSADYTTVLADAELHIYHPAGDNNARTFTIDSNANVAYALGTTITFVNEINTVTIAITSDTLVLAGTGSTGSRTLAANGIATAIKVTTTRWVINGTGLT